MNIYIIRFNECSDNDRHFEAVISALDPANAIVIFSDYRESVGDTDDFDIVSITRVDIKLPKVVLVCRDHHDD